LYYIRKDCLILAVLVKKVKSFDIWPHKYACFILTIKEKLNIK